MTKDEKSLWLFFETCITDNDGKVKIAHMNGKDFKIAEKWVAKELIQFKRILYHDIKKDQRFPATHTIAFSENAFNYAYKFRKERALRHNRWV